MRLIRNLSILLPLIFLLMFGTVYAESDFVRLESKPKLVEGTGTFERITRSASPGTRSNTGNKTLIEHFREQTESFAERIDISEYNITEAEFESVYEMLVFCSPRSYYLTAENGTYRYYYPDLSENENGETIATVLYPIYQLDIYDKNENIDPEKLEALKPEIEANRELFDSYVRRISQYINPAAKDSEKIIRYHNSIDITFSYATEELSKPLEERKHNNVISFIKTRKGLCQVYAIFFNYLLMQEGFDTGFVTSYDQYGHAYHTWNLVKITTDATHDNTPHWYHADTTWNDLQHDGFGLTYMKYLLQSDSKIRESHHEIWKDDLYITYPELNIETSTAFDNAHWHDAVSQIVIYGGKWYYIEHRPNEEFSSALCSYDPRAEEGTQEETVYTFNDKWYTDASKTTYYNLTASGLGRMSGHLYFNGPDKIYSYDIHSGDVTVVDSPQLPEGYSMTSCYIQGTIIHYGISTLENGQLADTIEGGTVRLSILAFSEATIRDNTLSIRFATDPECEHTHEVMFYVQDGDTFRLWNKVVDGIEYVNIPLESEIPPTLYIWDENMTPYTTFYYIDGEYYDYN